MIGRIFDCKEFIIRLVKLFCYFSKNERLVKKALAFSEDNLEKKKDSKHLYTSNLF